jgi:uncharacterized protein YbjT (DUF2867 family)
MFLVTGGAGFIGSNVVASLNEANVPAPNGQPWSAELFQREMNRLGS